MSELRSPVEVFDEGDESIGLTVEDLKSCPFCGWTGPRFVENRLQAFMYVECRNIACGAEGPPADNPKKAADLWNCRAP